MKDMVLIVDDEKILLLMEKIISKNYGTIIAENGSKGLKAFQDNADNISLVITDQTMPNMLGSEMITEIRKIKPSIPVIFITSLNSIPYDGGYHMLHKPFNISDLNDLVKMIMNSYHTGDTGVYRKG